MRKIILLLIITSFFGCKPVEQRIYDYSYTANWVFDNNQIYQVYKNSTNDEYILVLNKRQSKFVRKYIKK
jgi:hypothetical protein